MNWQSVEEEKSSEEARDKTSVFLYGHILKTKYEMTCFLS
jgi:hypothetical protein